MYDGRDYVGAQAEMRHDRLSQSLEALDLKAPPCLLSMMVQTVMWCQLRPGAQFAKSARVSCWDPRWTPRHKRRQGRSDIRAWATLECGTAMVNRWGNGGTVASLQTLKRFKTTLSSAHSATRLRFGHLRQRSPVVRPLSTTMLWTTMLWTSVNSDTSN
jgi:hypothetical protein